MQEIERKFLVDKNRWKPNGQGKELKQGYLSVDPERTVRVRIAGDEAYLTIKGKSKGISRTELEYEIPLAEAEILLAMCLEFVVEKTRYIEKRQGLVWEIDVFLGENSGLLMAEVELESENQDVEIPDWVEKEVSDDNCYFNSWLSQNPFSLW
jgi:adenylate cyclase